MSFVKNAVRMSTTYARNARKVICIGRNYVDHIKELGNIPPMVPFYFLKPTTSILMQGEGPILHPKGVNLHHELELAVVLGKRLQNVDAKTFSEADAIDAIDGYALSLDMTARNIQEEAKKKGLPWSISKGFDTFTALSPLISKEQIPDPHNVHMELRVNGQATQSDSTNLMIFRLPELLATISCVMTLEPGDIILTGTPKGVGPCKAGDRLQGEIKVGDKIIPESQIDFEIADKPGPYVFRET